METKFTLRFPPSDIPRWTDRYDDSAEAAVGAIACAARARTATPEEKARLWPVMAAIFPTYDRYQQDTSRDIPLVILERVES